MHVQLGFYDRFDISCNTKEHVYGLFVSLNCGVFTLMQNPKRFAGIVGRQLTLSKRSSTLAMHSQSLPRGLSIDPGSVPRQFEDVASPVGSDVALMRRRSMSMGQTPRSRVGLLRLMSRGQDVSKDVKYAALPMLCCLCCAVWAMLSMLCRPIYDLSCCAGSCYVFKSCAGSCYAFHVILAILWHACCADPRHVHHALMPYAVLPYAMPAMLCCAVMLSLPCCHLTELQC